MDYEQKLSRKPNVVIRSSDFSIDHILNKAGNSSTKLFIKREYESLHNDNSHKSNDLLIENRSNFTPILDWLQYTRYRPPKLPRPTKLGPVKRTPGRLPRIPFTPYQLNELEEAYKCANYLSSEDANKLAMRLDLTCTRVKIWFQNRRARERRENRDNISQKTSPKSAHSKDGFVKMY